MCVFVPGRISCYGWQALLHSINNSAPETEKLTSDVLTKSFERGWAELENEMSKIDLSPAKSAVKKAKVEPSNDKLELVLDEY